MGLVVPGAFTISSMGFEGSEFTARLQHAQLVHDTAIYRACGLERQPLLERGATVRRSGRVNIGVASGHYRQGSIRAKASAGFRIHANGPAGRRVLRLLGPGSDRSSLRGPAEHDPAALEL